MRISIHTLGTRGDVQPYLALALALKQRGHDVILAAPEQFAAWVGSHGVECASLPAEFLDLLDSPVAKEAIAGGRGFSAGFKLIKHVRPLMRSVFDAEWDAARTFRPDLVVHHPKSLAAPHIAEKLGARLALASPLPGFTPTSAFPSPMIGVSSLGPLNKLSHTLMIEAGGLLFGPDVADWRQAALGLPRRSLRKGLSPTLYAFSEAVVRRPADWGRDVCVSGYWFLDEDWSPTAELDAFLRAGEKPIYVGFGSMPGLSPHVLTEQIVTALARCGRRGVLALGGGALSKEFQAPHVQFIESAPHNRLLPLMSAALHHGGAGTTGAALRAGLPSLLCPIMGDQPFWARRVSALGVGPPALDRRRLDADALTRAFDATEDEALRRRAQAIGERIAGEDGPAKAIAFIEEVACPRALRGTDG